MSPWRNSPESPRSRRCSASALSEWTSWPAPTPTSRPRSPTFQRVASGSKPTSRRGPVTPAGQYRPLDITSRYAGGPWTCRSPGSCPGRVMPSPSPTSLPSSAGRRGTPTGCAKNTRRCPGSQAAASRRSRPRRCAEHALSEGNVRRGRPVRARPCRACGAGSATTTGDGSETVARCSRLGCRRRPSADAATGHPADASAPGSPKRATGRGCAPGRPTSTGGSRNDDGGRRS